MPYLFTAEASEILTLVSAGAAPFATGLGCLISHATLPTPTLAFTIEGCTPGASFGVTILANSYRDAAGNLGPEVDVFSPLVTYAAVSLPALPVPVLPLPPLMPVPAPLPASDPLSVPLLSPVVVPPTDPLAAATALPTPAASPEPTQSAIVALEVPQPPEPPAAEPAPVVENAEPFFDQLAAKLGVIAGVIDVAAEEFLRPSPLVEPKVAPIQPQPQIATIETLPEVVSASTVFEERVDASWIGPAASVIATALAAIGATLFLRREGRANASPANCLVKDDGAIAVEQNAVLG